MTLAHRVSDLRDHLRSQLWPGPCAGILVALIAGVLLPEMDAALDDQLPAGITDFLFGGGASAARTVLDAIASSLITVTSLTFSLTVVTLQLASSQFSPRLLRTFSRDRFVHVTLALFLGTFTYALTVLRTVRSADDEGAEFVPQISVTVAFVAAIASVVGLVLFLAHLAREIRVETMLRGVHRDAGRAARRLLTDLPEHRVPAPLPDVPGHARLLVAGHAGFLTGVDEQALAAAAAAADVVVVIGIAPGSFVAAGTPIGRLWSRDGTPADDAVVDAVHDTLTLGTERTDTQDYGFGLRQLTDVTSKALSPGVNDPTTAVDALGRTTALLCELVRLPLGPVTIRHDGVDRVHLHRPDLVDLMEDALAEPRHYGSGEPVVLARILTLLREVAWARPDVVRPVVAAHLAAVRSVVDRQDFVEAERQRLARLASQVDAALVGRWEFD